MWVSVIHVCETQLPRRHSSFRNFLRIKPRWSPGDMFIYMFTWGVPKIWLPHVTPIHQNNSTILQDGAPKIAKLVYRWLISMVYGRYNDLVFMGVISWFFSTNVHITGGHHAVSIETHGDDWGIPHFRKRNLHHIS